ncbi:MAG TPA: M23 family metallopeptidase [Pyrinomonadaceae bacterium]|nr:M23 family metallopeptidase [Pyrinomonadaceae bacterium]
MLEPLHSPVDPPMVVTQAFGINPARYKPFGLPGHEGLDIRAVRGAHIYAIADGQVIKVALYGAYGYQVRVQHVRDDRIYESIYAHGIDGSAAVKVGDSVVAGQLLMLADSTGNSSGSHLHLTLKCVGATARGETNFPRDIIDPTPFLLANAPGDHTEKRRVTALPNLRIRAAPSEEAQVVGRLTTGTVVTVTNVQNGWGMISSPMMGWVMLKWTEKV